MMRRRGAPTLYELTKVGGRGSLSGGSGGMSGGSTPSVSMLASEAARSVRVPVGFLWLLAIGVLGLAALTYAFGVGRGRAAGFAEGFSAKLSEDNARAMGRAVNDPLRQPSAGVSESPLKSSSTQQAAAGSNTVTVSKSASQNNSTQQDKASAKRSAEDSNQADPREKGVNYLTLARPAADQAQTMLEFCRDEGLAAHLVLDHNAKLQKIIVTPGLRSASALQTKEGRELLAKVKSVGVRWKAQKKGNKDFSDAYLELFR